MATERAIRQALARSLDDIGVYTVISSTATTATLNHWAITLTGASDRRYDGRWIFVKSSGPGPVQRAIKPDGYAVATGVVTAMNDSGWDTTLNPNDEVEITGLFPSAPYDGPGGEDTDYRSLINRGLARLLIEDRLDVTTVADQWAYPFSLTTYPWLDRMTRVMAVLDPPRATGLPRRETWRRHHWKIDGGAMTLEFDDRPYPTSGATFQVKVLRPANTLVNDADSTTGTTAPTDTVVVSVEEAVTAARLYAFEALLTRSKGRPSGDWSGQYAEAKEAAMRLARWDVSQDAAPEPAQQGAA